MGFNGGTGWSTAHRDYVPPPQTSDVVNAQFFRFLRQVGTFDAANTNETRQNGAAPLDAAPLDAAPLDAAPLDAAPLDAAPLDAAPLDADGYAPPSLLGAWALGPLLHNGSALTIDEVVNNTTYRRAGLTAFQLDPLNNAGNRRALIAFLKSIDAATPPFVQPFTADGGN